VFDPLLTPLQRVALSLSSNPVAASVLEDDSRSWLKEITLVASHLEEAPFVEFCGDIVMDTDTSSIEHIDPISSDTGTSSIEHIDPISSELFDLTPVSSPFTSLHPLSFACLS